MNFIEFQNVSFAYDYKDSESPNYVLQNFNLYISKGEFVAILGHNGCGKSTVAKLSNGIEIPSSGNVFVDGMDTSNEDNLFPIRKKVGMIFQNPDNQIVATIVEDDVAFGPENLCVDPKEIRKRVDDSLNSVGMFEFRSFEPHKLSGGQKQRVAIAGVLAMQPECIIFDESTAMLDPSGRKDIMNIAKKLHQQGITIIFITHYMDEAAQAQRVIIMNQGQIIADDTPKKVFSNFNLLSKSNLEPPEAAVLSKMLKEENIHLSENIISMDELGEELLKILK